MGKRLGRVVQVPPTNAQTVRELPMLGTPFEREYVRMMRMSVFRSRAMSPAQIDKFNQFAGDFEVISDRARLSVKPGRNLSLFQTKLEEAAMFLNKAIAHDGLIDGSESDGA